MYMVSTHNWLVTFNIIENVVQFYGIKSTYTIRYFDILTHVFKGIYLFGSSLILNIKNILKF